MQTILFWIKNARPKALPQSLLPALLAVCLAVSQPGFSLPLGILAILGAMAGHMGLNLFDDYFDYKKKKTDYRQDMAHQGFRARISKCTYLSSGKASIQQLLIACCAFSGMALLTGGIIWYFRGEAIACIALITGILGISYSGAPLRLSYHGLGEILIGIMFGPLIMTGTYYAACGTVTPVIILLSVPVGLLVANIVYVHSIMDFEPDKKIGKRTFAVLLNKPKLMMVSLFFILFAPYGLIFYGIAANYLSPYYGMVFLTAPIAIALFYMMLEYVNHPARKFRPRIWMGPMTDWKNIQAMGIDWFMIRWYLARNLLSFFCFIIMIVSFIA